MESIQNLRIGTGSDVHRFAENRRLILGGVLVPYEKGLLGHSDADALCHAVMDALLSGAGLKDIGCYFPDSDAKYKNADSIKLLEQVNGIINEAGYQPVNISAVIHLERPKIAVYIPKMRINLSRVLKLKLDCVGLTATSFEGLGFVGSGEGIYVTASCILQKTVAAAGVNK